MDKCSIIVIEDNLVIQKYLCAALKEHPDLDVIAVISNGNEAVPTIVSLAPDLVLLDLFLPGKDGLDIITEVMESTPVPIVVLSGQLHHNDLDLSFEALRLGAVDVLAKPSGMTEKVFKEFSVKLVKTIRIMSQIKVTRRRRRIAAPLSQPAKSKPSEDQHWDLLAIGCSTGGPAALYRILSSLPHPQPFPILFAQHISAGFSQALCNWLKNTGCNVQIPVDGTPLDKEAIYMADDHCHLILDQHQRLRQCSTVDAPYTPNVDLLFSSIADHFSGSVCALVLTGMGNDGASGIRKLHASGAQIIAESEKSAVIYGMPKAAVETGAVSKIASLDEIVQIIQTSTTLSTAQSQL